MVIKREARNPILTPDPKHPWEAAAVFNGCPVKRGKYTYLLYRALSLPHYHTAAGTRMMVSDIGIAQSTDGVSFGARRRFIVPEEPWERFGCEDPRVTELDGTYYVFYTALSAYPFRADGIRVGVALSKDLKTVTEKHPVTPFNAKGMALFPEKIGGKLWGILTVHTDMPPEKICVVPFNKPSDIWSEAYWNKWHQNFEKYALPLARSPQDLIENGAPPVKTKYGWLIFYAYVRGYFAGRALFTVEAVLLDLKEPRRIVARTEMPILLPDEYYERIGSVPNVVFPSGALVENDRVRLYYGAADTVCALASIKLSSLLDGMREKEKRNVRLVRAKTNPIIEPITGHGWERKSTFNPAALVLDGKVHLLYRAMSEDNTSVFGHAVSADGIHIDERSAEPVYVPREPFETKLVPHANSGCEDPRLTRIGDTVYLTYTAFDGKNPPRVALTSLRTADFVARVWKWAKPVLLSPPDFDDKDAFVFPEQVDGKYLIVHRRGDDIDLSFNRSLAFTGNAWLEEYRWIAPRRGWWDAVKVGAAAPPVKTKAGWVLLYHGISEDRVYRVGAVLLDLKNPVEVIGRTDHPILEPELPYEVRGDVPNVVFPCGTVLLGDTLFVYYGAADRVSCVATIPLTKLVKVLKLSAC